MQVQARRQWRGIVVARTLVPPCGGTDYIAFCVLNDEHCRSGTNELKAWDCANDVTLGLHTHQQLLHYAH